MLLARLHICSRRTHCGHAVLQPILDDRVSISSGLSLGHQLCARTHQQCAVLGRAALPELHACGMHASSQACRAKACPR